MERKNGTFGNNQQDKTTPGDELHYVLCSEITWGLDSIVAAAYWTKWFHPELNIAPEKIYREYLERFLNIAYPENLVFAY